jgi:hypothetical protein
MLTRRQGTDEHTVVGGYAVATAVYE